MPEKIVLAYSGGLDTTVAVKWLIEERGFDVVALTIDLGSQPDLAVIRERALAAGASRAYVLDARIPFIERFCWPALRAGALYQGQYPLATALGRPLIAQLLVEVAARWLRGATQSEIASLLGVSASTIARDIQENVVPQSGSTLFMFL